MAFPAEERWREFGWLVNRIRIPVGHPKTGAVAGARRRISGDNLERSAFVPYPLMLHIVQNPIVGEIAGGELCLDLDEPQI